ncbi:MULTISPECIES: hypothetical protein [Aeromonas]|uniref:hypothetical protein n=1 Tax=Aeromonas TaxID=642 RepID=UPI001CF069AB|nr:hypothetical protein [Aeromonas caviae]MCX4034043.1 hypothetical protein [Aeromonas caviae]MDH0350738.1 hypothetical protein [Aeromonas caviae]UCM48653.1 hypothetical protein LEO79_16840 [Aeromonas caviae]
MNTRPALCLLCSLGGIASPLLAAPDPLAHLSDHFAPELADGELAHLRGRYVSSHGISYFGIEFISSLTTAQAQQTAAMNLALSIVQNKPKLDVRVKDEVKPAATPAKEAQVQGAGLVQVVQLEGSGNSSVNQAGIELTPPTMTGHLVQAGSYEHQGDLGTATYRVSGNYAGLQLHSSDGRVLLEQSLRGTDFSRGLLQFNKVRGDGLQTLNQTRIWFSR